MSKDVENNLSNFKKSGYQMYLSSGKEVSLIWNSNYSLSKILVNKSNKSLCTIF